MNNLFLKLPIYILMVILQTAGEVAIAEEKICMPDPCVAEVDHIDFSRQNAVSILVGSFHFSENLPPLVLKNGDKYFSMSFNPKIVLKGNVKKEPLKFNMPLGSPFLVPVSTAQKKQDLLSIWNKKLQIKNITRARSDYERFEKSFSDINKKVGSASVNLALVKVSIGGLDARLRDTVVPVFEGEDYVVFIFRDINSESLMVFPWDFNIYPYELYRRMLEPASS